MPQGTPPIFFVALEGLIEENRTFRRDSRTAPHVYLQPCLLYTSEQDEQHLDHYEGFPYLYGKEPVVVTDRNGRQREIMAYTMNSPYKDVPAMPSKAYLEGILNGCRQNGIEIAPVLEAVWLTQKELPKKAVPQKKHHRRNSGEER